MLIIWDMVKRVMKVLDPLYIQKCAHPPSKERDEAIAWKLHHALFNYLTEFYAGWPTMRSLELVWFILPTTLTATNLCCPLQRCTRRPCTAQCFQNKAGISTRVPEAQGELLLSRASGTMERSCTVGLCVRPLVHSYYRTTCLVVLIQSGLEGVQEHRTPYRSPINLYSLSLVDD